MPTLWYCVASTACNWYSRVFDTFWLTAIKNPVHLYWRLKAGFLVQRTGMKSGSLQSGMYEEKVPNRQVCFWRCMSSRTIFHPPNALCMSLSSGFAVVRISQRHVNPCFGLHLRSGAIPNPNKETWMEFQATQCLSEKLQHILM